MRMQCHLENLNENRYRKLPGHLGIVVTMRMDQSCSRDRGHRDAHGANGYLHAGTVVPWRIPVPVRMRSELLTILGATGFTTVEIKSNLWHSQRRKRV